MKKAPRMKSEDEESHGEEDDDEEESHDDDVEFDSHDIEYPTQEDNVSIGAYL